MDLFLRAHEFIEVVNRRWCVGCDLYQSKSSTASWREPLEECPRYTAYAVAQDRRQT